MAQRLQTAELNSLQNANSEGEEGQRYWNREPRWEFALVK